MMIDKHGEAISNASHKGGSGDCVHGKYVVVTNTRRKEICANLCFITAKRRKAKKYGDFV